MFEFTNHEREEPTKFLRMAIDSASCRPMIWFLKSVETVTSERVCSCVMTRAAGDLVTLVGTVVSGMTHPGIYRQELIAKATGVLLSDVEDTFRIILETIRSLLAAEEEEVKGIIDKAEAELLKVQLANKKKRDALSEELSL